MTRNELQLMTLLGSQILQALYHSWWWYQARRSDESKAVEHSKAVKKHAAFICCYLYSLALCFEHTEGKKVIGWTQSSNTNTPSASAMNAFERDMRAFVLHRVFDDLFRALLYDRGYCLEAMTRMHNAALSLLRDHGENPSDFITEEIKEQAAEQVILALK